MARIAGLTALLAPTEFKSVGASGWSPGLIRQARGDEDRQQAAVATKRHSSRLPASRRNHLALWLVPVCALHLAALVHLSQVGAAAGGDRPAARRITIELRPAYNAQTPVGLGNNDKAEPDIHGLLSSAGQDQPTTPAAAVIEPSTRPVHTMSEPVDAPPVADMTANDDRYLPRSALSKPAQPMAAVDIDYPDGAPIGDFRAVLLLYVDEAGKVQRVLGRDEPLPPSLEAAARAAFQATRFAPGELEGRAVKSIFPVEVIFNGESQPRPAPVPSKP